MADFFVDQTLGLDGNAGTELLPWKTIAKVNAESFSAGDSIFFKAIIQCQPVAFVPIDLYMSNMEEMINRVHKLQQQVSDRNIRRIAQAAYQKQEQRLNSLRNECVRMLGLLVEKGVVTQEELNKAARDG